MKKLLARLREEHEATKSYPNDDFLEWLIKRKMTWGQRWIVVIILNLVLQPLFFHSLFLLGMFWIGAILSVFYVLGKLYFFIRSLTSKQAVKNHSKGKKSEVSLIKTAKTSGNLFRIEFQSRKESGNCSRKFLLFSEN